jgi:hypothetical protein
MPQEFVESPQPEAARSEAEPQTASAEGKLVPVAESIRYRRRAQQAEERLGQLEQQLQEMQSRLDGRNDEVARAESQRDEANQQLQATRNRMTAERLLVQAGVSELETACLLLGRRVDLGDKLQEQTLTQAVEQLLLDKPFLSLPPVPPLPPATASARDGRPGAGQLAQAADRAARSGSRREVAEYLRLRRQAAFNRS